MSHFGLYIHYPYCRRVCPFCEFVVRKKPSSAGADEPYLQALLGEMQAQAPRFAHLKLRTVYFGGGTPSLMPVEMLQELLARARTLFDAGDLGEVTIEVDPTTVDLHKLRGFLRAGVNRCSLGIQSLHDELLQTLGRQHSAAEARELIALCREAGVPSLSADLMYGIPGQSAQMWEADMRALAGEQHIQHLSLYNLSVEAGSRFLPRLRKLGLAMPDDETQSAHYMQTQSVLPECGFNNYELTAWCRDGFEAQHNSAYWYGLPYLGIGVGAHSYLAPQRWHNGRSLSVYMEKVAAGLSPVAESETLSPAQQLLESLMLGLRTRRGIAAEKWQQLLRQATETQAAQLQAALARCLSSGHLIWEAQHLRLSPAGMLLSNEILSEFCLT